MLQKNADSHYITHDRRMSVWIWHQVVLIEVTGRWSPETARQHLGQLFSDFAHLRQQWNTVYAIVDCGRSEIQTVTFRSAVKDYWTKRLNRSDLSIYFVENNAFRRALRAVMLSLVKRSHNVYICENYREISDHVLPAMRAEDAEIKR